MTSEEVSLGSLVQNMDVAKVDDLLSTLTKYERIFDKVSGLVTKLDKVGVIPAIIRVAGVKGNIPDLDKPLSNPLNIQATTGTHMVFYGELNKLPENLIAEMYKQMLLVAEREKEAEVVKDADDSDTK